LHLLFKDCGLGCSASKLAVGVDTRGAGGFIIWWPAEGHEVVEAELAPVPDWIIEQLKPPTRSPQPAAFQTNNGAACSDVRVRGIIGRVAAACPNCDRNSLTFWAACRLRDMVVRGEIDGGDGRLAFDALAQASRYTGLTEREIQRTIVSALTTGAGR
jgi:hypothetical protein